MRLPVAPKDRPHTVHSYPRATTYRWVLATVPHPDADSGTATIETILTVAWHGQMKRYQTTLHQQTTWTEAGEAHHSRDPGRILRLADTREPRLNVNRLASVAKAAVAALGVEHLDWFDLTAPAEQLTLRAA